MEPIFQKRFTLYGNDCDCFGRVKPSTILGMMQEAAGEQCAAWHMSWEEMAQKDLFWAITRQTVSVTRLPRAYETRGLPLRWQRLDSNASPNARRRNAY